MDRDETCLCLTVTVAPFTMRNGGPREGSTLARTRMPTLNGDSAADVESEWECA